MMTDTALGELVEGDAVLIEMARVLHPPSVSSEALSIARMEFSNEQWTRLEAAAAVVRAPLLSALQKAKGERDIVARELAAWYASDWQARAQAAEARVKALEALLPLADKAVQAADVLCDQVASSLLGEGGLESARSQPGCVASPTTSSLEPSAAGEP